MGSVTDSGIWPMREGINEVIATTYMNAAPMGIICRNGKLMMAVFRTSHTADHIEKERCIVANITHDPILFVKAAFSDLSPDDYLSETIDGRTFWRLKVASSWVVYDAYVQQRTEQKILVSLTPIHSVLSQTSLPAINRGLNSVIEAVVHGTRFVQTRDSCLKQLIDHHADLIRRCGGEPENEALRLLMDYIL